MKKMRANHGNDGVFRHGVASGDPLPDRVVLWTRVEPADGEVSVVWRVARDPGLRRVVAEGEVTTDAGSDFTVHVDAAGLEPGTAYHYGFEAEGERSPVGRTGTTPVARVDGLRFAAFSCAKYSAGYFNAWARIADRDDLDFVLCLGDYIYEYSNQDKGLGAEIGRAFEPDHRCVTLEDYRTRYAHTRKDPDAQAMHAAHPVIAITDDHEFADNAWRHGAKKHDDAENGPWEERRAAAFRAWREWMPVRLEDPDEDGTRMWRSFSFGDLVDLLMLDSRTRRDEQSKDLEEVERPDRVLLGDEQFAWLTDRLTSSRARWRLIGQSVMIAQVKPDLMPEDIGDPLGELGVLTKREHGPEPDQWDGYPAERDRLLRDIRDHEVGNVVFVSGDVHSSWACDLRLDPHDPEETSVAVEFCTTSVTSENLDDHMGWGYRTRSPEVEREVVEDNPHISYAEFDSHGFLLIDVDPD